MNERLIDAIIFGTTCIKAQDKLLQTPNTLNLQQCLTVCRHYESLSLHIQQIHPGSNRHIEFLCKHHPKTEKSGQNKPQLKGQKIHDAHLGIVKSKLLGGTLVYWPNWNSDVEMTCQNCTLCREKQPMPANILKFQVKASSPGEIYGIDITDICGRSHIVCVDYYKCCIFGREL